MTVHLLIHNGSKLACEGKQIPSAAFSSAFHPELVTCTACLNSDAFANVVYELTIGYEGDFFAWYNSWSVKANE